MEVPRHWRLKQQRYSLVGEICQQCRTHLFPPRDVCPHCGNGIKSNARYQEQQQVIAVAEQRVESIA
jgi:uncharacterized protein